LQLVKKEQQLEEVAWMLVLAVIAGNQNAGNIDDEQTMSTTNTTTNKTMAMTTTTKMTKADSPSLAAAPVFVLIALHLVPQSTLVVVCVLCLLGFAQGTKNTNNNKQQDHEDKDSSSR
jgi:hypothetical protein